MNPNLQERPPTDAAFILPGLPCNGRRFALSFFDDDEPPTRQARPRRPATGAGTSTTGTRVRTSTGGGAAPGDPQQLMVRRAVALGAGALILILLLFGVRGCLNSRAENALRDYNRNVESIVTSSNDQVSRPLFELFAGAGADSNLTELQQSVNQIRVTADEDVERAEALDVPGDMEDAQLHLLQVLSFRAEGVEKIAEDLPSLEGDQSEDAAGRIAGQMSAFLASDVIYASRVVPFITQVLADKEIDDEPPASVFLPDSQWIDAAFARRQLTGRGSGRTSSEPTPGTHGHGLVSTTIGDVTLQPGGVVNRVPASSNPVFNVTFANQGENDEFDVNVKVGVSAPGSSAINVQKRVDQTAAQTPEITLQVPLGKSPTVGTPSTVRVEVVPVPGEQTTDNNSSTYTVIFER